MRHDLRAGRLSRWRVRLRPGIVATFLFVMVPLSVAMLGILYWRNAQLAVALANDAMQRASRDAVISVQGLFNPIARTVSLSAALGRDQHEVLRQPEYQRLLLDNLEQLPNVIAFITVSKRTVLFCRRCACPIISPNLGRMVRRRPPERVLSSGSSTTRMAR